MAPIAENANQWGELSWTARAYIFVGVPVLFGWMGLVISYIETLNDELHQIDFKKDFVWPWGFGLLFVIVVGFRTGGFKGTPGQMPAKPARIHPSSRVKDDTKKQQ